MKSLRLKWFAAIIAAVAMSTMMPTVARAAVQPLALSFAQNSITATDSAHALDATSELYLVWDSVDRGSDLGAWPVVNRVQYAGTVPSADSTYEFTRANVPAGCSFRVIATSKARRLGDGGYVYAGTSQYINTGIKANAIYGLYMKFMYSANDYNGPNAYGLLISDEGNKDFAVGRYAAGGQHDGKFYVKHRNTDGTPNGYFDISGSGLGKIHEFAITNNVATLDGSVALSNLANGTVGQKDLRVWLNNGYTDNSTTEGSLSGKCCHARWYSVRFDDENGDAILNLVPAVRNGVGVLYDTVSCNCLVNANSETGDLTYGGEPGEVLEGTDAVSAVSDAVANEIAVALVAGAVEVSVPAGILTTASELWLVWDSEDRGGNLADWPVANRLKYAGAVSSAAATYRFPKSGLSPSCVFRVIANDSVSILGDGGYVYVGANQYVNTSVKANEIYGFFIKFQYSANDWNQGTGGNGWSSLIGDDPTYDFTIGRKNNGTDGQFYMRYRGVSVKSGETSDLAFQLSDKTISHEIVVTNQTATLDGALAISNLEAGTIGKKTLPVLLGCSWAENSTVPGTLSQRYCHAKWYSVRFDDAKGDAILNLAPAVIGGSVAVFYDSVSGKILKNAGTGSLTFDGTQGVPFDVSGAKSVPVSFKRKGLMVIVK